MIIPLRCFCDFLEAGSTQQRNAVIKRYKKGLTGPSKGMIVYYSPALQLMRGRLCPSEPLPDKLKILPSKCFIEAWPEKLNTARLEANTLVFKAFHAEFGNRRLKVFASPRLHCILSSEVAVAMQPELHAEVDGIPMVWKLGLSKVSPNEETIRNILQMLYRGLKHKGFSIPIHNICYFDVRAGKIHVEEIEDSDFVSKIGPTAAALAKAWGSAA